MLRHVTGEGEADGRRAASHAAFKSTMSHEAHLDRYTRLMRSPVYEPTRDLIAVAPNGRIVSFMVWWPDTSGIAQIEQFGTHPDFHRQGIAKALLPSPPDGPGRYEPDPRRHQTLAAISRRPR